VVESGDVRERVWNKTVPAEQARDPDKKGVAVLVDVERAEELSGKAVLSA